VIFQLVFAAATVAVMFYFLVLTRRSAFQRLFVTAFFGVGTILILLPDATTNIAHMLGVGRGADLVFYVSLLFLFVACFHFYLRFKRTEEQITVLTRELALGSPVQRERDP
jgi:small membrane protein